MDCLDDNRLLTQKVLRDFDLAVTFYSSSYVDTLLAGVPIVFLDRAELGLTFPELLHPLIRSVHDPTQLSDVAAHFAMSGTFPSNPRGEFVDAHLSVVRNPASAVADVVMQATLREQSPPSVGVASSDPIMTAPRTPGIDTQSLLLDILDSVLPPQGLLVVGDDFSYLTGVAVPILTYSQQLAGNPAASIRFANLRALRATDRLMAACVGSSQVLFNSAASFWRWDHSAQVARWLIDQGIPVALFLHETAFTAERAMRESPERFGAFLRILPDMRVLCVSHQQASYVKSLGARDTVVVYNAVPESHRQSVRSHTTRTTTRVLMVGTVQDRKGPDLFSRVAELADASAFSFEFRWVGPRTQSLSPQTYLSDLVDWVGPVSRQEVQRELLNADVLLLPSVDDPMPLAAIEAVGNELRVVTSAGVGTAEILEGIQGYASFAEYTPPSALAALQRVMQADVDRAAYSRVAEVFRPSAFALRLNVALHFARVGGNQLVRGDGSQISRVPFTNELFLDALSNSDFERAAYIGEAILRERSAPRIACRLASLYLDLGRSRDARTAFGRAIATANDKTDWLRIAEAASGINCDYEGLATVAAQQALRAGSRNPKALALAAPRTPRRAGSGPGSGFGRRIRSALGSDRRDG